MSETLSEEFVAASSGKLKSFFKSFNASYPGESGRRQPVHTVYGGAHLFKSDTATKLGMLAARAMDSYAADPEEFGLVLGIRPELAETIFERVKEKLSKEAVEDLRIDFEDGYGTRTDDEEDDHAVSTAREMGKGFADDTLPPFSGIRIKALSEEAHPRAIRTLDLFLTTLVSETGGKLPDNFVVTLPKIVAPEQVALLADILDKMEPELGLAVGTLKLEMMIETTQSIIGAGGEMNLPRLLDAARGRCTAAHFGAYDYTASCGITAANQDLLHPACDFARNMMQVAYGGTGIWLSDGATNIMPVGPHRGEITTEQAAENRSVVQRAWKLHYDHVRHSLASGFYQGWDLHPAQMPTRYAAVYAFFLEGLDAAAERLQNFVKKAAQATLVGDVFDDAATGQGLLNYFVRAVNCGALTEETAVERSGLTLGELRSGSFAAILEGRRM